MNDDNSDELFNLDPGIFRTTQERIKMVTHPACPIENLKIVATHDSDDSVIEACIFNTAATDEVFDIVIKRLGKTKGELLKSRQSWLIQTDPKFRPSFCVIPWMHAATNSDGSIRMCCQMIHDDPELPFGEVNKDDGTPLTMLDDIGANRNAPNWKLLRKTMLEGKRHDVCKLCWDEEHNKIESKRQQYNSIFNSDIGPMLDNTAEDGTINAEVLPIKYWDLRFGNKCNIKCRTCGPNDSDQWYSDWIALGQGTSFPDKRGEPITIEVINGKPRVAKVFDWVENSPLFDEIQRNISTIKRFYFTGGEPTINLKHRELLDYMIKENVARDVVVEYNTNMAGIPDSIFEKWYNFKEVHLGMSIDGIYEHFEYIRHPAKWDAVDRNIKKVDTDLRLINTTASFSLTLSIMNVVHLLDMIWWAKEQKFKRINPNIVVHNLYWPKFYNIQHLPVEIKVMISNLYENFIDDIYRRWTTDVEWCVKTEKTLRSVLTHMNEIEPDDTHFKGYFARQDGLDKIRKENWKQSLSGISDIIAYHQEIASRRKNVKLDKTGKQK
jgi:organic radical activating enzyme